MSTFSVTTDTSNKDIPAGMTRHTAKQHYLSMHATPFVSKLPDVTIEDSCGRRIVRCDASGLGFKAIAAERLVASINKEVIVYCAPRAGHAAMAIAELARLYGKRAVFFAPASLRASSHQLCTIALGAELRFVRIAAMPVLNYYAKRWAERHGAAFLPFGLANTPDVTAGIVAFAEKLSQEYGEPEEFWCATSTGTMIRGLQIGWPNARAKSVAVARNMHPGEIGCADVISADIPFLRQSRVLPPFPSTAAYDAKAWEPCLNEGSQGAWFINVGCDRGIEDIACRVDANTVNSFREWGDYSDLERGL